MFLVYILYTDKIRLFIYLQVITILVYVLTMVILIDLFKKMIFTTHTSVHLPLIKTCNIIPRIFFGFHGDTLICVFCFHRSSCFYINYFSTRTLHVNIQYKSLFNSQLQALDSFKSRNII